MAKDLGVVRLMGSIHHRAPAKEKSGFVHYREGCLCQRCPHYFSCRVTLERIGERRDTRNDTRTDKWVPLSGQLTPAMKKILELLRAHPEGYTARQIAAKLGLSARHTYRCMSFLVTKGFVAKIWQLQREKIIDTMLRHYETTEIAHRYVISSDKKP